MQPAIMLFREARAAAAWLQARGVQVDTTEPYSWGSHWYFCSWGASRAQTVVICTGSQMLSRGFPEPARPCTRKYYLRVGHCLLGGTSPVRLLKVIRGSCVL